MGCYQMVFIKCRTNNAPYNLLNTLFTLCNVLEENMLKRGLFVPGLFRLPNCKRFAAVKDAVMPYDLQIVDFTKLYAESASYKSFVEHLKSEILIQKPDFIITYCFGNLLYRSIIANDPAMEVETAVFIMPMGDYGLSKNGHAIVTEGGNPEVVYGFSDSAKLVFKTPREFYVDAAEDSHISHDKAHFKHNALSFFTTEDEEINPGVLDHLRDKGVTMYVLLDDNHRLTNSMNTVCNMTRKFVLMND